MVDVSSQNNSVSINVSTGGNSASIKATPDMAKYYSEKSREWAISNRIVDNTDYSSKYYAEQSKVSANEAEVHERSVIEKYNSFIDVSNQAETELQALRDDSVAQIKTEAQIGTSDIVNNANNAVSDINASKEAAQNSINAKAREELSNIDNLAKSYDNLTQRQITNCITEIPQRIKYDLVDGMLTIKAGSVVIVPYGTQDLTNQFLKGALIFDNKLKVVDTQFGGQDIDDKFFIWAEIIEDCVLNFLTNSTGKYHLSFGKSKWSDTYLIDYFSNNKNLYSGANPPVVTSTTNNQCWYDTTNNIIKTSNDNGVTWTATYNSLPFMVIDANSGSVQYIHQEFNGVGYIGNSIWRDKDLKVLMPNGRNQDGSLKNLKYTTPFHIVEYGERSRNYVSFVLSTGGQWGPQYRYVYYVDKFEDLPEPTGNYRGYVREDNLWYFADYENNKWMITYNATPLAELEFDTNLLGIKTKKVFEALDKNELPNFLDGQWVFNRVTLANNVEWTSSSPTVEYDLSDYLPDDGCNYEVLFSAVGNTGSKNGNFLSLTFQTDMMPNVIVLGQSRTRADASVDVGGCCILPVGSARKISKGTSGSSNANGTYTLYAYGYRRLGDYM